MSFLNGTAKIQHKSKLPSGVTRAQAVAMLQDHAFYLACDPHMVKFSELTPDQATAREKAIATTARLPPRWAPSALAATRYYEVHDLVHNLPGGLWDSNVVSTYEVTDVEAGVFVRIRSPMGVVMDTFWEIAEAAEGGGGRFELVEEISISASRLILGLVKSLCEGGWQKIHDKMIARLRDELAGVDKSQGDTGAQQQPTAAAGAAAPAPAAAAAS